MRRARGGLLRRRVDAPAGPSAEPAPGSVVTTCLAPATNLRFEPDGTVVACCVNSRFPLGHVSMSSIREIWDGVRARELEEALAVDDFSLGCQECASEIEAGNRSDTYAPTFDRFAATADPAWPRRLEFAVSNRCNLMCVQCNGDLSSAIRSRREHRAPLENHYGDAFFDELPAFLAQAEATVFLGGEPFLQPEAWRIWDQLLALDPSERPTVDVTTNGTRWDRRVERYVRDLKMNLGVSLDAVDPDVGEAIRVGTDHAVVMANLRRLRAVAAETRAGFSINACLLRENWQELPALLALGDEIDVDVEVLVITYPRERSLLLLPPDELRSIVERLEARDAEMQAVLGRNLHRWDATVRRLRSYAEGALAVPVEITVRRSDSDFTPPGRIAQIQAQVAVERERLAASAGTDPFEVLAQDGTVREVLDRPWAEDLAVSSWVGSDVEGLLGRFADRFGSEPTVEVVPLDPGVLRVDVSVSDHRYAIVVAEWVETPHRQLRALVSEVRG